jgi:hypothetical protein
MRLLRGGIDSLYLAIQGTLPPAELERLVIAKEEAIRQRCYTPLDLGPGCVPVEVLPHGDWGGYPFVFDTGPVGELWSCRPNYDGSGWNLYVRPHATALVVRGCAETIRRVFDMLQAMGAEVIGHRIGRVDYAIDIHADDFSPTLGQFIKPPRAKVSPHWRQPDSAVDQYVPAAIICGRGIESVTIGKMPGWQVILYDKTAEIQAKHADWWWDAWGLDADADPTVWRIELRAGRRELRERRQIRSLRELNEGLRDVLQDLAHRVRYVSVDQTDSNVNRQRLHPIWKLVVDHINEADLIAGTGELPEQRILELTRKMKREQYEQLILGNSAGWAAVRGYSDDEIKTRLPEEMRNLLAGRISRPEFHRSIERKRKRFTRLV